jgi:tetratricopeptide (TPR) repeat protein
LSIGAPNACNQNGCHDDQSAQWAVGHFDKWYGLARKPHYGTLLAAGRSRQAGAEDRLAQLARNTLYPPIVRATALHLLGSYAGEKSTAAFNTALSDEEALVRYTAVTNFNANTPGELVGLVAPLLFDEVKAVRMQAAARLAGVPDALLKPYQQEALYKTIAEYEVAMGYSLDFAFAGYNLGNLYTRLNVPQRAERYYKAAIEIDGLFYPAKVNLAMLYNSEGRKREAEELFRDVLTDHPEQYDVAYSLGLLLAETKRFEEAAGYLERAASGLPRRSRISYNLGLLLQQLGRLSEAEAALCRAADLEPRNVDYLYALADHYVKRGLNRKALPYAERMVALDPRNEAGRELIAYIRRLIDAGPR